MTGKADIRKWDKRRNKEISRSVRDSKPKELLSSNTIVPTYSHQISDLNMNTFDIINLDRIVFATEEGAGDTIAITETGIEAIATGAASYGMKLQIPVNQVFQFYMGSVEKININTSSIILNGVTKINDNYLEMDAITAPAVTSASVRRLYVDSADNHLKIRTDASTPIDLEGGGSSGWVGTATSDLDMNNFTIEDVNVLKINSASAGSADSFIMFGTSSAGALNLVDDNDFFDFQVDGDSKFRMYDDRIEINEPLRTLTANTPDIGTGTYPFGTVYAQGFNTNGTLTVGTTSLLIGVATHYSDIIMDTNDIQQIQNLEFSSNSSTPSTNGTIYAQDISGVRRVFVRTGNTTKDLTDIGSGSGGSGANTSLSNLTSTGEAHFVKLGNGTAWTAVQHFNAGIDLNDADIDDVGRITFEVNDTSIASTNGGLQYNIPSGDTHIFGVNSGNQLQIGETTTYSGNTFAPSSNSNYALGASNLRWSALWSSGADIDGIVNITGSVVCQGNVNLGNDTTDIISLNGGVKIGSGTNNTIGFFGQTPIPQLPVSTSASLYTVIYALRAYGLFS